MIGNASMTFVEFGDFAVDADGIPRGFHGHESILCL